MTLALLFLALAFLEWLTRPCPGRHCGRQTLRRCAGGAHARPAAVAPKHAAKAVTA